MNETSAPLVQIEKPIYGGAFLARLEGKAMFVPLALPGEQVAVRIVEEKRHFANAEIEEILVASNDRVTPDCKYFGVCGGCVYQHASYAAQLRLKQAILRETLERGGVQAPPEIDVVAGEPWGYRNRVRMAFDATGDVSFRERQSHALTPIADCPISAPVLMQAAQSVAQRTKQMIAAHLPSELTLFCNANETAVLASLSVSPLVRSHLDEMARVMHECVPSLKGFELVMKAMDGSGPRTVGRWGDEWLSYRAADFDYRVDHGAFFQVNRWLVDALVERVTADRRGKLAWDLFAGVGLFARQLTKGFARVVAVESAPAAMPGLAANLNGTSGIAVCSDTLQFLRKSRAAETPDFVVVDPPRAGLGAEIAAMLATVAAPEVVYVSCDPATLARDLRALTGSGYTLSSVTLVDLFPQTFHLEAVVTLRRS